MVIFRIVAVITRKIGARVISPKNLNKIRQKNMEKKAYGTDMRQDLSSLKH